MGSLGGQEEDPLTTLVEEKISSGIYLVIE
jgi:hypothetical protein